jgi:serine/threonine protein kinase
MQVCCTRPIPRDDKPHIWNIPKERILGQRGKSLVLTETEKCKTCGMPLILDHRYIPTKELGHGGFGKTFLAIDRNFPDSMRVMKQFSTDCLLPGQIIRAEKAFEKESRILDQLNHPKIPRVISYFLVRAETDPIVCAQSSGQQTFFYMAQEYIKGKDLQQLLKENKIYSEEETFNMLKQMLEVLEYIHTLDKPVIHCDIKPSNIIYNFDTNTYHLIDFGAFKRVKAIGDLSQTSLSLCMVSAGFSPPEQLYGKANTSSDLYALAMTCICLLTGKKSPLDLGLPEDRENWKEKVKISQKLTQILSKMINFEPSDRYSSAADVRQALNLPLTLTVVRHQPPIEEVKLLTKGVFEHLIRKQFFPLSLIGGISVLAISALVSYLPIIFSQNKPLITSPINREKIRNFSSVQNVPSGTFKFGGSTTWGEIITKVNPVVGQAHVDFHLNQKSPEKPEISSSESGISMLINKKLSFAISSKGIPDYLKKEAENKGIRLKEILVARSWFALAVHPSLHVSGLTTKEYGQIKNGEIKNWKEIKGGPDLKIQIYSTDEKYGYKQFSPVKTPTEAFIKIKAYKGGLHEAAVALVVPQCTVKALSVGDDSGSFISPYKKFVPASECSPSNRSQVDIQSLERKNYPFSRELSVILIQDGSDNQRAGEAYANMLLTVDGQERIQKAGYSKAPLP